MNIKGIQLKVGDTVMVSRDKLESFERQKVDEVLIEFEGQCTNGLHFRTKRNAHVCYDKCADLVIA